MILFTFHINTKNDTWYEDKEYMALSVCHYSISIDNSIPGTGTIRSYDYDTQELCYKTCTSRANPRLLGYVDSKVDFSLVAGVPLCRNERHGLSIASKVLLWLLL